jgi:hypothetical protein
MICNSVIELQKKIGYIFIQIKMWEKEVEKTVLGLDYTRSEEL